MAGRIKFGVYGDVQLDEVLAKRWHYLTEVKGFTQVFILTKALERLLSLDMTEVMKVLAVDEVWRDPKEIVLPEVRYRVV